jgi:hypothetical protein
MTFAEFKQNAKEWALIGINHFHKEFMEVDDEIERFLFEFSSYIISQGNSWETYFSLKIVDEIINLNMSAFSKQAMSRAYLNIPRAELGVTVAREKYLRELSSILISKLHDFSLSNEIVSINDSSKHITVRLPRRIKRNVERYLSSCRYNRFEKDINFTFLSSVNPDYYDAVIEGFDKFSYDCFAGLLESLFRMISKEELRKQKANSARIQQVAAVEGAPLEIAAVPVSAVPAVSARPFLPQNRIKTSPRTKIKTRPAIVTTTTSECKSREGFQEKTVGAEADPLDLTLEFPSVNWTQCRSVSRSESRPIFVGFHENSGDLSVPDSVMESFKKSIFENAKIVSRKGASGFKWYHTPEGPCLVAKLLKKPWRIRPVRCEVDGKGRMFFLYGEVFNPKKGKR